MPLSILLPALALGLQPDTPARAIPEPTNVVAPGACDSVWEGRVVDSDTGEAVPGAQVEIRRAGERTRIVRTDHRGIARFGGLCESRLRVSVRKDQHSTLSRNVEVTGRRSQTRLSVRALHDHHSERVIVVHDEEIAAMGTTEQLAGAALAERRGMGLAETISGMAGVTMMRGSAGGMAKPVIRGQVGRRNLIVFDGVRHEGQKWGLDHAPEVDPSAAGRLTVIKGAATTRFGADAIGGVVLVDPRPLMRSPGAGGEVSAHGGTNALGGGGALRFDHAPRWGRGFAWRAEANAARRRAATTPSYALDNTAAREWNAGVRAGYLRERGDLELSYRLLNTEAGLCTCLRILGPEEFQAGLDRGRPADADDYRADFAIDRAKQAVAHHVALARGRIELGRAGELHATYAYQFNHRREFEVVRSSVQGPQLEFALGTHSGELRYEHAAVRLRGPWQLVGTAALQARHQVNDFDGATTLVPDYEQLSGGASAVERLVHPRVEIELGAAYEAVQRDAFLEPRDYLAQSATGRLDADRCAVEENGAAQCARLFHAPSATAGVLWRPLRRLPELSARFDANSSARVPAIDEQLMNGAAPSFPILGVGDARLGVERTWGGTSTLAYEGDRLLVEAAGFGSYVDDYINFGPAPQTGQCAPLTCTSRGAFPVFAFAATDAVFGGAELRIDADLGHLPFEISGNAAWVRGNSVDEGRGLPRVPADRYELRGRYRWPDTIHSSDGFLELAATYVDRQRNHDAASDFAPPPSGYVLLGAGAGVEFPRNERVIRASLRGTNLLNQRYRDYASLLRYYADEIGWGLQLRVSVEFGGG